MNRQFFDVQSLVPWFVLGHAFFFLTACQPAFERVEGATMGTYYGVVYQGCEVPQLEIEQVLTNLNAAFSTYLPDSEISEFNLTSAHTPVEISEHFAAPLTAAANMWLETEGALDPTVGPLVDLWGFGAERGSEDPSQAEQDEVSQVVGWQQLTFQDRTISKAVDGLRLDLSAIAKGYAVDVLARLVSQAGCKNYMVDIGGEMAVAGHNADGGPWRLGIERPDPDALGVIQLVLEVTDMGIATSGDYRNYRVIDGKRVDHVMDPRIGRPADNQVVSATVIHPETMYADGYATAAMVLGVEQALKLADEKEFAVLVMTRSEDDAAAELHYNSLMKNYMVSTQ